MSVRRAALPAVGLALAVVAYRVQIGHQSTAAHALAVVAVGLAFLCSGLAARAYRPRNRLGALMIATGFALLLRQLRYSDSAALFTLFFLLGELPYAMVANVALAYPSGRVTDRLERLYLRIAYATALLFPLLILLFHGGGRPLRWFGYLPPESVLAVASRPELVTRLQETYAVVGYGFLAGALIALLLRKFARATNLGRRILAPLLFAAVVAALRAVFDALLTFWTPPPAWLLDNLFWWQIVGLIAMPIAFVVGLLGERLAHASVGDLVRRLEHAPPTAIRDELARALSDPSLEVAFWLPERGAYADAAGRPFVLPQEDGRRAVTRLENNGVPVAALVHDAALRDEPELVDAAAAAARLALENARLHAEVHAQLDKVKESRARIVAAGDVERRRIERDLHDGAQQRLVALALELRTAQQQLGLESDPEIDRLLASAVGELQTAVAELRELARGIHPAVLTESGLAVALESLGTRSSLPVTVEAELRTRPPEDVEATAYFVACEGLANVVKHAHAAHATIRASHRNGTLRVEVLDDGVGGASIDGGTGLRGLVDRVEAVGGTLRLESTRGGGTRLVGEIPCAS